MYGGDTNRSAQEICESDDEFPSECEHRDDSEEPAYLNDERFDDYKFSWIKKSNVKYFNREPETSKDNKNEVLSNLLDNLNLKTSKSQPKEKVLILKDCLSKRDLFCLSSFEPMASDASFMWFLHYLLEKDMQRKYSFLKSCLIPPIEPTNDKLYQSLSEEYHYQNHKFHIKVVAMDSVILYVNDQPCPPWVIAIPGDGSCLFHSLSFSMYNNIESSYDIRLAIIEYVVAHWDELQVYTCDEHGDTFLPSGTEKEKSRTVYKIQKEMRSHQKQYLSKKPSLATQLFCGKKL